jgi:UDP-glucose 4-epimerase
VRREAAARQGLLCRLELGEQTEFPEPPVRINTDLCDAAALGWSETQAWDEFAAVYGENVSA